MRDVGVAAEDASDVVAAFRRNEHDSARALAAMLRSADDNLLKESCPQVEI